MKPSATGLIAARANQLREQGIEVHDFGAGDPVLPNHPILIQAAQEALGSSPYAPTAGLTELREEVAAWMNRRYDSAFKTENVAVTVGGKFGIFAALNLLLEEGDEVIIPAPHWVSYPEMVRQKKAEPIIIQTRWKLTPELLEAHLSPKTRVLILNNACNPTGVLYTKEELEALLKVAEKANLFVISDEVYSEIVYDGASFVSMASFEAHKNRVLIIESCSKNFAMAGWRIGFAIGPENMIEKIIALQSQSTSGAPTISQKVALAALKNADEISSYVRDEMDLRRKAFAAQFAKTFGFEMTIPPSGLYHFMEFKDPEGLLESANVVTVPGEAFGTPGYMRLSFAGTVGDIKKGLEAIRLFLL